REISQDFAIETDACRFQTFCQPAISHAVGASRRVQALDPEIAEGALASFAIAIGPVLALHGRVFGVAEKFRSASAIAFGFLYDTFASLPAGRGVSSSWHYCLSRI